MRIFVVLFWVLTIVGVFIGSLTFFAAILETSAPKQAAAGTIALGFVIIPYVLARAVSEIAAGDSTGKPAHHQNHVPGYTSAPIARKAHMSPLANNQRGQRPSDAEPVAQRLWDLLQDGPCSQRQVFNIMKLEFDLSSHQAIDVGRRIGIQSHMVDGEYMWRLI